jgi:hypothetical protein
MGRSFESVRMGVRDLSSRWARAGRALKKEDQVYGTRLAAMAKKHSSEAFYALDDPLEAAVFSVLVELLREMEAANNEAKSEERNKAMSVAGKVAKRELVERMNSGE